MSKPTKLIVNCETGEETIIELTAEEIAEMEQRMVEADARRATEQAQAEAKAEAKASALAKLTALGLTEDEAKAITD
jgi:DNA-binding transcriptional regulator YhcF (GntR family)